MLGLLGSCCGLHTNIDYQFNDVTINRVDVCGKSMFYYKNVGKERIEGQIWVEYSGINDGFRGYLVFQDNGKVLLLSGDGYFQSENLDTSLFEFKRIIAHNRPEFGLNVCEILFPASVEEKTKNKHKHSIEIKYQIDENEWW
jgi:hypothetical protein